MSRLGRDPHPRTTTAATAKRPSSGFTSAAARLLLQHDGGKEEEQAGHGESIEFFNALRKCLPDPDVSGQTARGPPADRRGKARLGGAGGSADELLASAIEKHDYDWLLTPPGTPGWSPATSTSSGHHVSAAVPSRLAKAGSATHMKSNSSRLGEKESPATSRLSNCSSASSLGAAAPPGRLMRVRTSSASSINTASNASAVSSTPLWSAVSSPRTPCTARSCAAAAALRHHHHHRCDKARHAGGCTAFQSTAAPSRSRPGAPARAATCTRASHSVAAGVPSSPRSTASATCRQPSQLARRAEIVLARSRLAGQSAGVGGGGGAGSTPQPREPHLTTCSRGAHGAAVPCSSIKSRPAPAPAAVKQDAEAAAATATAQRWQKSLAPAIAAARGARRETPLDSGSRRNSAARKIMSIDRTAPHRTTAAAAAGAVVSGGGLTRTSSQKLANANSARRPVSESEDCRRQQNASKHGGGAPARREPTLLQQSIRSVASRSRLGLTGTASGDAAGSISSGGRQPAASGGSGQHAAAAAAIARVAGPDAFPSARYDAMLLREDPKNLTWLRGCDDGGDDGGSGGGLDLVDASLEPFYVTTTGLGGAVLRFGMCEPI